MTGGDTEGVAGRQAGRTRSLGSIAGVVLALLFLPVRKF